jgi:hypothetical protein
MSILIRLLLSVLVLGGFVLLVSTIWNNAEVVIVKNEPFDDKWIVYGDMHDNPWPQVLGGYREGPHPYEPLDLGADRQRSNPYEHNPYEPNWRNWSWHE